MACLEEGRDGQRTAEILTGCRCHAEGFGFCSEGDGEPQEGFKEGDIVTRLEINNDHSGSPAEVGRWMVYPGRVVGCVEN